ncbi:putative SWI/SNF-related matrix-associated actin-dependent regulator of chromatin subfamily A member 3-like 1 [Vicia villosa]|uniref:putative SWI/SNF-related matrix-associated actin-dependent regulator of chromatin subfamily A member 3-like 1 n=1 Tax=Vicia villosa TaxID=3911 RepID=UPI00273CEC90|nr:putative SWI/SNF-related matrix-associated actin-dependent regulator of chromatin subfamily A member 3-like 1 [Vicia villosa]
MVCRELSKSRSHMNFRSSDIVVVGYDSIEYPANKYDQIFRHSWERLVVENVISQQSCVKQYVLSLNAKKKWVLEGIPPQEMSRNQFNFVYSLLFPDVKSNEVPLDSREELLREVTLNHEDLYPFGSKAMQTVSITFTPQEEEIYLEAQQYVQEKLKDVILVNTEFIQNLERWIIRLREMASHISLRLKMGDIEGNPKAWAGFNSITSDTKCTICQDYLKIIKTVTACGHCFCETCWFDWFHTNITCCLCQRLVDTTRFFSSPLDCESSKVRELVSFLCRPENLHKKSMVTSKFELLLGWLEEHLGGLGLTVHRIGGEMTTQERFQMVKEFEDDANVMVLLIHVKYVTMEFTSIHHVFVMEAMKISVENELLSHFKGTEYSARRFIVNNSIESKIVGMHDEVPEYFEEFSGGEMHKILT